MSYLIVFIVLLKNVAGSPVEHKGDKGKLDIPDK